MKRILFFIILTGLINAQLLTGLVNEQPAIREEFRNVLYESMGRTFEFQEEIDEIQNKIGKNYYYDMMGNYIDETLTSSYQSMMHSYELSEFFGHPLNKRTSVYKLLESKLKKQNISLEMLLDRNISIGLNYSEMTGNPYTPFLIKYMKEMRKVIKVVNEMQDELAKRKL